MLLSEQCTTEWLRNKSQSELWVLRQQGNPQDIIQYSIALSSQLNQVTKIALTNQSSGYVLGSVLSIFLSKKTIILDG